MSIIDEHEEVADSIYQRMTTDEREKFWFAPDYERKAMIEKLMPGESHTVLHNAMDSLLWLIEDRMGHAIEIDDDHFDLEEASP